MTTEVFATSDTHFGHERNLVLSNRPFATIEEHDECLISNWNSVVPTDGLTFIVGDAFLGDRLRLMHAYLPRLNGRKILVSGNHDKTFAGSASGWKHVRSYLDAGFEQVMAWGTYKLPPTRPDRTGRTVLMSHFPYDGDSRGVDRHSGARLRDEGQVLLHGHVHGKFKTHRSAATGALQVNVGVDVWDYTPVSMTTLAHLIDNELGETP